MRYIQDIPDKRFKISVYQWNNKYIIKIESGLYEQTYKIEEYEITDLAEIEKCMDETFLILVATRFSQMQADFAETLQRNEVTF